MSIKSQIDRINENIARTYNILAELGAEIPQAKNSNNLPGTAASVKGAISDTTGIPDYVVTEGKRVANGMISKRGSNSITAVIMSDMHEFGDNDHTDATIIERHRRANRNAGQGAKVVADNISIDFFANLGDLSWGAKTSTVTDFVQSIVNARMYMYDVEKDHETFIAPGNHDTATYGFAQNNEYLSQNVIDGLIGSYRYVDFTAKKVRVICLNTAEVEGLTVSGQSGTERITGTQLQWFANALDLSTKSDAAKWGIVILSHHPLDWGAILPAANCLNAYVTGANYSVTHNGVAVSKNFSGKNAAKVICQFHGHVHGFRVDKIRYGSVGSLKTMDVKRVAIPNACFARTNEYGENTGVDSNGMEFGETTSYEKVDGTAENTAFCLVSIDLDNEVIYADCYGAGYDRVISYAAEVLATYTVTNNLSNAKNSNGASSVTEGSGYYATINANAGYELSSVKVTMGGSDITSSAVSGNNITIANVTGNIVITATAVVDESPETGDYTNLVLIALDPKDSTKVFNGTGYKDNAYVNNANDGSVTGYVSTGGIYLPSGVQSIYVRGCEWDETVYTRFNNGSKETPSGYASHAVRGDGSGTPALSELFTLTKLGDKYFKLTVKDATAGSNYLYTRYYRMSLKGSGADLIITHDQPIPEDATGGGTATTYTVTNTLTNVTTSNSTASVISGVSYSATLTTKSGYTLTGGTVKVTMGGTDITSSAYSNGKITITQVTGNIVITASAVVEQSTTNYTNLVSTSEEDGSTNIYNGIGYKEGVYCSSNGGDSTDTACVATGNIPYTWTQGNSLYIKGADVTTTSHVRISGYSTKGSAPTSSSSASGSNLSVHFTLEQLGDHYYKLTHLKTVSAVKYLRLSLIKVAGQVPIVTLNEPIE